MKICHIILTILSIIIYLNSSTSLPTHRLSLTSLTSTELSENLHNAHERNQNPYYTHNSSENIHLASLKNLKTNLLLIAKKFLTNVKKIINGRQHHPQIYIEKNVEINPKMYPVEKTTETVKTTTKEIKTYPVEKTTKKLVVSSSTQKNIITAKTTEASKEIYLPAVENYKFNKIEKDVRVEKKFPSKNEKTLELEDHNVEQTKIFEVKINQEPSLIFTDHDDENSAPINGTIKNKQINNNIKKERLLPLEPKISEENKKSFAFEDVPEIKITIKDDFPTLVQKEPLVFQNPQVSFENNFNLNKQGFFAEDINSDFDKVNFFSGLSVPEENFANLFVAGQNTNKPSINLGFLHKDTAEHPLGVNKTKIYRIVFNFPLPEVHQNSQFNPHDVHEEILKNFQTDFHSSILDKQTLPTFDPLQGFTFGPEHFNLPQNLQVPNHDNGNIIQENFTENPENLKFRSIAEIPLEESPVFDQNKMNLTNSFGREVTKFKRKS